MQHAQLRRHQFPLVHREIHPHRGRSVQAPRVQQPRNHRALRTHQDGIAARPHDLINESGAVLHAHVTGLRDQLRHAHLDPAESRPRPHGLARTHILSGIGALETKSRANIDQIQSLTHTLARQRAQGIIRRPLVRRNCFRVGQERDRGRHQFTVVCAHHQLGQQATIPAARQHTIRVGGIHPPHLVDFPSGRTMSGLTQGDNTAVFRALRIPHHGSHPVAHFLGLPRSQAIALRRQRRMQTHHVAGLFFDLAHGGRQNVLSGLDLSLRPRPVAILRAVHQQHLDVVFTDRFARNHRAQGISETPHQCSAGANQSHCGNGSGEA